MMPCVQPLGALRQRLYHEGDVAAIVDHGDSKCPKKGVNLLSIEACNEKILAITREQVKKARYLDVEKEKKSLQQTQTELEKQMGT